VSDRERAAPAPMQVDLEWEGGLRFRGRTGDVGLVLESSPREDGVSPVQALGFGLAGCMAMDVASILEKGRLDVRGLRVRLLATRAAEHPRQILTVDLDFRVEGAVPPDRVERAIELSRERYCSVWHSMREDIELKTHFEITGGPGTSGPS